MTHEHLAIWADPTGQQPLRVQPFDDLDELSCPFAGYVLVTILRNVEHAWREVARG